MAEEVKAIHQFYFARQIIKVCNGKIFTPVKLFCGLKQQIVSLIAIVVMLYSCDFKSPTTKPQPANSLNGKWTIDSLTDGKDSNSLIPLMLSLGAMGSNNKNSMQVQFEKDTIITTYGDSARDTAFFTTDTSGKFILINDDFLKEKIHYNFVNDRVLNLLFKDSTLLHLTRQ